MIFSSAQNHIDTAHWCWLSLHAHIPSVVICLMRHFGEAVKRIRFEFNSSLNCLSLLHLLRVCNTLSASPNNFIINTHTSEHILASGHISLISLSHFVSCLFFSRAETVCVCVSLTFYPLTTSVCELFNLFINYANIFCCIAISKIQKCRYYCPSACLYFCCVISIFLTGVVSERLKSEEKH